MLGLSKLELPGGLKLSFTSLLLKLLLFLFFFIKLLTTLFNRALPLFSVLIKDLLPPLSLLLEEFLFLLELFIANFMLLGAHVLVPTDRLVDRLGLATQELFVVSALTNVLSSLCIDLADSSSDFLDLISLLAVLIIGCGATWL